jgi:hypothetical protein
MSYWKEHVPQLQQHDPQLVVIDNRTGARPVQMKERQAPRDRIQRRKTNRAAWHSECRRQAQCLASSAKRRLQVNVFERCAKGIDAPSAGTIKCEQSLRCPALALFATTVSLHKSHTGTLTGIVASKLLDGALPIGHWPLWSAGRACWRDETLAQESVTKPGTWNWHFPAVWRAANHSGMQNKKLRR